VNDQSASHDSPTFGMVIVEISGTRWGEAVGRTVAGATVPAGTPIWVVRRHKRALRARVVEIEDLQDERVRVVLEGWGYEPLLPGYGVATDPDLLNPLPAARPELTRDRYRDDSGPPLQWTWGEWNMGVDGDVVVDLAQPPSQSERPALERVLSAWSDDGVAQGFGIGYMHGFEPGPRWSESTLRWKMDFGSADVTQAANELARRLAGWSRYSGVDVVGLKFGT
jgi:hypothetical protein